MVQPVKGCRVQGAGHQPLLQGTVHPLDHALVLDLTAHYEVALLDALPDGARAAAIQQTTPVAMAEAADKVVEVRRPPQKKDYKSPV